MITEGSVVWHVVTGPSCTGVVTELGEESAKILWVNDCRWCREANRYGDNIAKLKYLREVGEPE